MWMGTYPSVPSYVLSTGEPLEDFLKKNPDLVGKSVVDKFGGGLPFLPKVRYHQCWGLEVV
jgi:mannose-6-phosphate isomerase